MYVAVQGLPARSAPNSDASVQNSLARGDIVFVYQKDNDGWVRITPNYATQEQWVEQTGLSTVLATGK